VWVVAALGRNFAEEFKKIFCHATPIVDLIQNTSFSPLLVMVDIKPDIEDDHQYAVEALVAKSVSLKDKKAMYLVKWAGCGIFQGTGNRAHRLLDMRTTLTRGSPIRVT
jgi:hypothetical protein